ncbi:MAG: hypothetical protein U0Z70_14085 [Thermomicrobiales bacterium]
MDVMSADDSLPFTDLDPGTYLESRQRFLAKVVMDHALWEHLLALAGRDQVVIERQTAPLELESHLLITPRFLDGHRRILVSLMQDMATFGPSAGMQADRIVAQQLRAFAEIARYPEDLVLVDDDQNG